jgi:hypothetical protein
MKSEGQQKLEASLVRLPIRALAYWGLTILRPCFDLLASSKKAIRQSTQACQDLLECINGDGKGLRLWSLHKNLAQRGLDMSCVEPPDREQEFSAWAIGEFMDSLSRVYIEAADGEATSELARWSSAAIFETLHRVAQACKKDEELLIEQGVTLAGLLLIHCGEKTPENYIGPVVSPSMRAECERLLK